MAIMRFTFSTCNTSAHELAKTISRAYEDATYDGIYYDSIEVKSSGDKEKDNLLLEEIKHVNSALLRYLQVVTQF